MTITDAASTALPDHLILHPLRQLILEKGLGVQGIHLHRAGHEDIQHRFIEDSERNVFSCSKTVTALAIGIARGEGLLDVDDLLVDHLPAPRGGYGKGVDTIRISHLLSMMAGSPVTVFADEERQHPALTDLYLGTDLVREPGERFEYSNGSIFMLSRIISARTGQSMRDYLMPRLFEPLGLLNPQWHTDRQGFSWGSTGLHLKTPQLARIGRLMLQRGVWEGTQLVPAEWIDLLHAEDTWVPTGDMDPESVQYGYGIWRCSPEGAWRADGAYGQFVVVLPEQQAVVTINSHQEGAPAQDILRAVWSELLPLL
jgi:CubicO group peptidase (beta-lactamase class C family)